MIIVATTCDGREFPIKANHWEDFDPSGNENMLYLEREDGGVFAALPGEGAAHIVIHANDETYVRKSNFFWTILSDDSFEEAMKGNE